MNLSQLMRGVQAARPVLLGLCLFPVISPAPVFMKYEGVDGESTDKDHKDWIIIQSIDDGGIVQEMVDGLPTGKRKHKPLVVTKAIDKATPLLMNELATGETTPEVILELTEPVGESPLPYYLIRMKKVLVTSVDLEGDPDRPLVTGLSLEFPYAEWHYQQYGRDGTVIDHVNAFFDAELNVSGPVTGEPIIEQVGNVVAPSGATFAVDLIVRDSDTPYLDLNIDLETDPSAVTIGPVRWMAPESLRISGTTSPTYSGQTTITVRVSDGSSTTSMSFSLFVDSTGSPWEGFMQAYFTEEERRDSFLSSPIGDPDEDFLATILEFLLGTNPREFTPAELQRKVTPRHVTPTGPDDDGDRIDIEFRRRIDEPMIRLTLYGSPDGETWTQLRNGSGDNPLYKESSKQGENPLYESVTGTINPPGGTTGYFVRFIAEMN